MASPLTPESLAALRVLAEKLCSNHLGKPTTTSIWGPWEFNPEAHMDCTNLWAQQIPLARVHHPEVGAYLSAVSPDVLLGLLDKLEAIERERETVNEKIRRFLVSAGCTCEGDGPLDDDGEDHEQGCAGYLECDLGSLVFTPAKRKALAEAAAKVMGEARP